MGRILSSIALMLVSLSVWAGPKVNVETTLGDFTIELNQDQAPVSAENFLKYVADGSYEGTIFHRVIPGFMAQGGGFDQDMNQQATYAPIKNESSNGLKTIQLQSRWLVPMRQILQLASSSLTSLIMTS